MNKKTGFLLVVVIVLGAILLAACGPTVTQEALSVDVGDTGGPRIVAQSPIAGQRLDLDPVIELTFDRAMNPDITAAAWSFHDSDGNPVAGTITWPDAKTFSFTPTDSLVPDSDYTGTFAITAADANAQPLAEELRLSFHTITALAVSEVFPADQSSDVEVDNSITVVFNRPVVPLTVLEDQASLPQPLEIDPPVTGSGEWVNSSMYIFQPDQALNSGVWYTLRISAGLADVSGNKMGQDYTWQFSTRPVSGYVSDYMFENIHPDGALHLNFAQPMDANSVQQALTVVNRETGISVPMTLKWSDNNTYLKIEPAGSYRLGSFYTITVATTAKSQSGVNLAAEISQVFSTLPYPRIESVSPEPDSQAQTFNAWFSIQFASPMDLDTLKTRVKVVPQPENDLEFSYDSYNWTLYVGGLSPDTQYIIRLLPGMADIFGNTIQSEYSYGFQTGNWSPYAALLSPYYPLVYRADQEQGVFFEYTNIEFADIGLYPVTFDEFASFVNNSSPIDPNNFQPSSNPIQQWTPTPSASKNRLVRTFLKFTGEDGALLSPGYYFIGLKAEPFDNTSTYLQGVFFMVSTDSLTLKSSPTESLAWLVDLETGTPTSNVPLIFYNEQMEEIGRATTNADGLVYLDGTEDAWFARTDDNQHSAFISQSWGSGVSTGQYGLWWNYYTNYSTRFVYVYTERPLYRPGQDVFFNGFVRRNDDLHYSLPFQPDVYVRISLDGEEIHAGSYLLSEMGSFSGSFRLDDNAALGNYELLVYSSAYATEPFGSVSFRVADYRKPEFQVLAATSADEVLVGDDYSIELDATYYSGGNVAGADVYWYLESSPYYFNPTEDYNQFSFSNWDRDEYWSDPELHTPSVMEEGYATTDENGHVSIPVNASLGKNKTSRAIQIYSDITDQSGNIVGVNTSVIVHQSEWYAGIRSQEYIGTAGEEQTFQMVVLDWASNPIAGQPVSVEIVRREWYSVQEQDENGTVTWVTTVKDVPVSTTSVVTGADGLASVVFTPATGGIYKALVTVKDPQGHTHKASTYLWVSGSEYIPWRQTNDRSFDLVADQDTYTPGDTAEILIAQPFEGEAYALVTVERGHIYSRDVIRLENNSTIYKLPITAEMTPAMYVSVLVIRGAGTSGSPDFKMGLLRLNVDTSLQTLNVSITTDKPNAGPGDEVTYTVTTTDLNGNPVQADVSLALVDKALLALAPANSQPIVSAFYPQRALNIITSVGIIMNADDFNSQYQETAPEGESSGGGGGGKGLGDEGIVTVRENFKDTAFFQAQVVTGADGRAQVTVTLPENLTTWVMDARAATVDSLVGQATHELVSSKPMFIKLLTPRFFTSGDSALIGATVFNNTALPLSVDVTLEAEGLDISGSAARTVSVPANGQVYLTWETTVQPDATRVDLLAHASSGTYEDTSAPPLGTLDGRGIPVYGFTVNETAGTSGLLAQAGSVTEAIQVPSGAAGEGATLTVELSPSLASSLDEGLTYLKTYQYDCMEQTASRLVANVLSLRTLQASGQENETLRADLDQQVNGALQRIYANQNYDGGWGWWNNESQEVTTTYVLYALLEARDDGYPVSENILTQAVDYLYNNVYNIEGSAQPWEYNYRAFLAYVMVRAGQPQPARIESLYYQRDHLYLFGKAYLAQAMFLENPDDQRIDTLLSDLASASILSASGAHWEEPDTDFYNWNSDLRTTAIVLNAFVQMEPENPITANAVRWLVSNRSANAWESTQQTVWTLTALSNWLIATDEFQADYRYAVGINGNLLQEGTVTPDNLDESVNLQLDAAQALAEGLNYLVITRSEGTGNLYYSAFLHTKPPVANVEALDNGISISRQYFSLDDDKTPITEIQRGEVVRVRVTVIAPGSLHYVVVNDPLPAGLEAIDSSLLTDVQVPSKYTYVDYFRNGWGWWYFDHTELRDEKVVISADYLPAGTYVYTYLARASTAGTFNVIPTTAEEFYFPDVYGRGGGSVFTVTP